MIKTILMLSVLVLCAPTNPCQGESSQLKKIQDLVIYQDEMFYSAFPSLVVKPDGEILCAFRRAPNRKGLWNKPSNSHVDPNSYLVLVRSKDGGNTWSKEPELIYAHPLGGSQDPCMVQLKDGSIVCTSYAWAQIPPQGMDKMSKTSNYEGFGFLGGYIMRSDDGAKTWKGPFVPMNLPGEQTVDALGGPLPAYNRGAMLQRKDGKLNWVVVRTDKLAPDVSSVHLLSSTDRGETWQYACPVAADEKVSFNETSIIETTKGDLVAFMRTDNFEGKIAYAVSKDGGKSFEPWQDGGFFGHPFHAVKLKDGRIFLVYGYRKVPFGIRAKLLNPDCTDIVEAPEFVLRDDGGNYDIGYPWAALLPDEKILVAYYFNKADGTRHIAGTILSIAN